MSDYRLLGASGYLCQDCSVSPDPLGQGAWYYDVIVIVTSLKFNSPKIKSRLQIKVRNRISMRQLRLRALLSLARSVPFLAGAVHALERGGEEKKE